MSKLTIIGDVHGKYKRLHEILREEKKHTRVIQLGDLGFDYATLEHISPERFSLIAGNHDNYNKLPDLPHYLGDAGVVVHAGYAPFFFYRGAWSIDRMYRTAGIDWWPEEQVLSDKFDEIATLYSSVKPDLVITHDCPSFLIPELLPPGAKLYWSYTPHALEKLYELHRPKMWVFGHYHKSFTKTVDNTQFICLDELEVMQLSPDLIRS